MPKARKSRPVQAVDRLAVRAIALDSNVFGKGEFKLTQMKTVLQDAVEADVEVWVPEVVAWELASNVADQHEAARESTRGADGALRRAGLQGIGPSSSSGQLRCSWLM
jgi:hypothetical protein